jgi:hypothetical protein
MNPLGIDIGYNYNENEENPHSFLFGVFFDIPFEFLGYYWDFVFNNSVQFRIHAPVLYENQTGLSMNLPFRSTTFTFGVNERVYLKQNYSDEMEGGELFYISSNPYISWRIPTGLTVSRFGDLAYTPSVSATFNHEIPKWPLADHQKGPFVKFSHSLGFGNIDWHGNYREGLSFSMGNSYQYDFYRKFYDISFELTGIGHHVVADFFAVSARLMYRYWYSSDVYNNGSNISNNMRGIADDSIPAYQALTLNLDLPFRLFAFTPSTWLKNDKLRIFDLEFHASPVVDLALHWHKWLKDDKTMYDPPGYDVTAGLELVVFSLFMRSLYVRLGFAINAKQFFKDLIQEKSFKIPDGRNREIYFIMGHFF